MSASMDNLVDDRAQLVVSELMKKVQSRERYPTHDSPLVYAQLKKTNDHRDELVADVRRLTLQIEDISMSKIKVGFWW